MLLATSTKLERQAARSAGVERTTSKITDTCAERVGDGEELLGLPYEFLKDTGIQLIDTCDNLADDVLC
jgi:hypothetical protein